MSAKDQIDLIVISSKQLGQIQTSLNESNHVDPSIMKNVLEQMLPGVGEEMWNQPGTPTNNQKFMKYINLENLSIVPFIGRQQNNSPAQTIKRFP